MKLATSITPGITLGHDVAHYYQNDAYNRTGLVNPLDTLQTEVNRVRDAGGGVISLVPGTHLIHDTLLLPRGNAVKIAGFDIRSTVIQAANDFPTDKPLIAFEQSAIAHCWNQGISGITLDLNNRATKAIHYQLLNATTWDEMRLQRLQIVLRDIQILCHNDYHEVLIDLEGGTWYSEFTNIVGNPTLGDNTYDTLLLRTGNGYPLPDNARYMDLIPDSPGLFSCRLNGLYSTWSRGGRSRLFEGRLVYSQWTGGFCDGGSTGPCYWLKDSLQSNLTGLACEGREEKPAQWLFEDCANMQMQNCSHGSAKDFKTHECGNGVELRNCRDMQWNGKLASGYTSIYSIQSGGKKAVVLDENCRRCTFTNWNIRAVDVADEFSVGGTGNRIDYVRLHSGAEETGSFST